MDDHRTAFSDPTTVEARRTSFGAGAATYDAVRPLWPEPTVHWLLGEPDGPLRVLDHGAGTGLGTRTIATLGHDVTAVDPSAELLAALDDASTKLPREVAARITTLVGRGEELDVPDASHDAVTCFQAWPRVDPDLAGPECARVVRPGGVLALAWNSWSDREPWLRELGEVVGTPEMVWDPERHGATATDQAARVDGFDAPENTQFGLEQALTVEELVRLASSWSPVAVRDDRDAVLDRVRALGTEVAGSGSTLVFPYVSDCWRYRRR